MPAVRFRALASDEAALAKVAGDPRAWGFADFEDAGNDEKVQRGVGNKQNQQNSHVAAGEYAE